MGRHPAGPGPAAPLPLLRQCPGPERRLDHVRPRRARPDAPGHGGGEMIPADRHDHPRQGGHSGSRRTHRKQGLTMQLSIDLTGRTVLVTGSDSAARQAVRRYRAAGAVVSRLSSPQGAATGPAPEGLPFLVAAVDDGRPGWAAPLDRPDTSPWWAAGPAPATC